MDIAIGFDIALRISGPSLLLGHLSVHPSVAPLLHAPEQFAISPALPHTQYSDSFGNRVTHIPIPAGVGTIRLHSRATVRNDGLPDREPQHAAAHAVQDLPPASLQFLLPSRYCDFDGELLDLAWQQFGAVPRGWAQVRAISDYVHQRLWQKGVESAQTPLPLWSSELDVNEFEQLLEWPLADLNLHELAIHWQTQPLKYHAY